MYRKTNCPSYKEKFLFGLEASEFTRRSLTFYVYSSDKYSNTLIGEAELKLCDVTSRQPVTTWLTLTDTGQVSSRAGAPPFGDTKTKLLVIVVIKESINNILQTFLWNAVCLFVLIFIFCWWRTMLVRWSTLQILRSTVIKFGVYEADKECTRCLCP